RSQRCKSEICVDFPEPSMPSTMISLPGYGCASVRPLTSLSQAQCQAGVERGLEGIGLAARRPQLELSILPRCPHADNDVLALARDLERADDAKVTAIEPIGDPEQRRQRGDRGADAR